MKNQYLLIFILVILSSLNCYSQKTIEGLPNDLNKETIIFLEFEQIPIEEKMNSFIKRMYRKCNEYFLESNSQLRTKVENYPFKYVISRRSEYRDSLSKMCKYLLECDLMENGNNGINLYAGRHTILESDLYIKDLKTGDKYLLFKINTYSYYNYDYIMKDIFKMIKKKFPQKENNKKKKS